MFKGAIIKLTAFCNLNCSYCYMFNLGDKTFMDVPKHLSMDIMEKFIRDVYDYMRIKNLRRFDLTLHGGEPFLWSVQNFSKFFKLITTLNSPQHTIYVNIQTNAYKINWDLMKLLADYNVPVGISIDGPAELNDQFRVTHGGRPTYHKIMDNVGEIFAKGYSKIIGGFLTVANPVLPAEKYFEWIQTLPLKRISVLWPIEFNYKNTPWDFYKKTEQDYLRDPMYGKWFADLFKLWWYNDDPNLFIRYFYETVSASLGGKSHGDTLVNDELSLLVLNTDGAIEYHDYFRALSNRNNQTSFNITKHNMMDIEEDILFRKFFNLKNHLPSECHTCFHKNICGGGFLPGRMDKSIEDFSERKSVLCYDEYYFFSEVKKVLSQHLSPAPDLAEVC